MRMLLLRFLFIRALVLLGLISIALYFLYRFYRQDNMNHEVKIR